VGKRTTLPVAATAIELIEAGHSQRDVAERTGLSRNTVQNILHGEHGWDELTDAPIFAQYRAKQNKALELAYRNLAAMSVIRATELVNDPRTQYHSLVLGSGIAVDKAQLLGGLPTQNIAVHARVEVEGMDELAGILGQTLLQTGNMASKQSEAGQVATQVPDNATPDGHMVSTTEPKRAKAKAKRKSK
jgi:transcriptional regulator with XRE-family HTH domain